MKKHFNLPPQGQLPIGAGSVEFNSEIFSKGIDQVNSFIPVLTKVDQSEEAPEALTQTIIQVGSYIGVHLLGRKGSLDFTLEELTHLSNQLWDKFGVRSLLIDAFLDKSIHPIFGFVSVGGLLQALSRMLAHFHIPSRFMNERIAFPECFDKFLYFIVKDNDGDSVYKVVYKPIQCSENSSPFLSQAQKSAIKEVRRSIALHRRNVSVFGFKPRTHMLLAGMSGVGKTFSVIEAARLELLPIFSVTLPSWVVLGGRGAQTLCCINKWLVSNPQGGIIHIDEVDKIPLDYKDGNSSWFSAVRNEIIRLLDCHVDSFPGYESELVKSSLRRSLIVASGTFQELFRSQISREANLQSFSYGDLPEQSGLVSDMSQLLALDADDIILGRYLPEELVNRFSREILFISPPTIEELSRILSEVDACLGIFRSDNDIVVHATKIFSSGVAFRGIEDYILSSLK